MLPTAPARSAILFPQAIGREFRGLPDRADLPHKPKFMPLQGVRTAKAYTAQAQCEGSSARNSCSLTARIDRFGQNPTASHTRLNRDVECKCLGDGKNVLVATATHVHHDQVILRQPGGYFHHMRKGVRWFQCRDDAFHGAA